MANLLIDNKVGTLAVELEIATGVEVLTWLENSAAEFLLAFVAPNFIALFPSVWGLGVDVADGLKCLLRPSRKGRELQPFCVINRVFMFTALEIENGVIVSPGSFVAAATAAFGGGWF